MVGKGGRRRDGRRQRAEKGWERSIFTGILPYAPPLCPFAPRVKPLSREALSDRGRGWQVGVDTTGTACCRPTNLTCGGSGWEKPCEEPLTLHFACVIHRPTPEGTRDQDFASKPARPFTPRRGGAGREAGGVGSLLGGFPSSAPAFPWADGRNWDYHRAARSRFGLTSTYASI